MAAHTTSLRDQMIAFDSFGVSIALTTNEDASMEDLRALVPPHSTSCSPDDVQHRLLLRRTQAGPYDVRYELKEGEQLSEQDPLAWVATAVERSFALAMIDSYVHNTVALYAPDHVFVQRAVVAYDDRALVMPGKPLTGRTTFVKALVAAGLTYVSDEYAIFDREGRVHPYARALDGTVAEVATEPLSVGAVLVTSYWPGAAWQPVRQTSGAGLLALMSHSVGGQERPDLALGAMKAAMATEPVVLETRRGEADEATEQLLSELRVR